MFTGVSYMQNLGKMIGIISALFLHSGFWGLTLGLIIGHILDYIYSQPSFLGQESMF